MLAMVGVLDLEATSADRSVLQLLDYMREHTMLTRDYIPDRIPLFDGNGRPVLDPVTGEQQVRIFGTSFASENWNKAIRDRARPGMFVRRHLEACVLTYLAGELRTGDIAVTGAATYANWADQLLTPAEVAERLPAFCAEVGIPATATTRFRHIEALFGEPGRNVIDWDLIERHYDDLMRVVLSVAAGKISSVTLLRRLSTYSRRNNFYKAFREVGRVIRTIQLLRYLSDPQLRRRTTAATNKVESYNNFSAWCRFGNEGRVRDNDPAEQEKQIKFSTLLTNAVIFHTTLDMMMVLRQLAAEGWEIKPEDLAVLSPYLTMRINRFGVYATDEITITPEQYDAHLPDIDLTLDPVP